MTVDNLFLWPSNMSAFTWIKHSWYCSNVTLGRNSQKPEAFQKTSRRIFFQQLTFCFRAYLADRALQHQLAEHTTITKPEPCVLSTEGCPSTASVTHLKFCTFYTVPYPCASPFPSDLSACYLQEYQIRDNEQSAQIDICKADHQRPPWL
jgi:hypothetical protein